MIKEKQRISYNKPLIGRPKGSMPQKGTSVYIDLQMSYYRKIILESNLRILMSRVKSLDFEIGKTKEQISKLESCIKTRLSGDKEKKKRFKPGEKTEPYPLSNATEDDIMVVNFEY
jgi:hypothetical protein